MCDDRSIYRISYLGVTAGWLLKGVDNGASSSCASFHVIPMPVQQSSAYSSLNWTVVQSILVKMCISRSKLLQHKLNIEGPLSNKISFEIWEYYNSRPSLGIDSGPMITWWCFQALSMDFVKNQRGFLENLPEESCHLCGGGLWVGQGECDPAWWAALGRDCDSHQDWIELPPWISEGCQLGLCIGMRKLNKEPLTLCDNLVPQRKHSSKQSKL